MLILAWNLTALPWLTRYGIQGATAPRTSGYEDWGRNEQMFVLFYTQLLLNERNICFNHDIAFFF